MSDAASAGIQYLLGELSRFASHHIELIRNASEEAEKLAADLEYFNAFLRCVSSKKIKDDTVKEFVRRIRFAVFDAEDAVDAFVTQATSAKSAKWYKKLFKNPIKIDQIAQKISNVRKDVEAKHGGKGQLDKILSDLAKEEVDEKPEASTKVKDKENVVGLDGQANEIIKFIQEDTQRLDIITIVGMPGLGKSTLAGKILRDPTIQYEFPTHLWIYVSKFTPKDVFLSILREFTSSIDEKVRSLPEGELAKKVKGHLERGKFLIVMDDVWSPEDWEKVSACLPTYNHLGKIIITSRFVNVAGSANPQRPPYEMKLLEDPYSEELLQYEVFGEPKWDLPQVEPHGKIIAHQCKGLPLAIVVIGGIIKQKVFAIKENARKVEAWQSFQKTVKDDLISDPRRIMDGVISWSYRKLPPHLQACFLYFGMFPEDVEVPAWKLYRMWIAEGFIPDSSVEDRARNYLEELVSRNLVRVNKRSRNGNIKTCIIHDSLRDFCKKQAGQKGECFLEEIKEADNGKLPLLDNNTTFRRISIHSNVSKFVSSKPFGGRVRSFVCFSKENVSLETQHISAIPAGFKLLRILDAEPIKFPRIPSDVFELLYLRYIHLSYNAKENPAKLPSAFSKLFNMQTLIVDTSERDLVIEANIWKMINLTSVKTKAIAKLPQPARDGAENEHFIQTLGTISLESCTSAVLKKARRLKRVSIRGDLRILLDSSSSSSAGVSFDYMTSMSCLERLKLHNDVYPKPPSEGKMTRLPPSHSFPPNLKILTLKDTYLDWSQMRVLSSLFNLEVLKLKEKAFMGNTWEVADGGFDKLGILLIEGTDLVVWNMSAGNFPNIMHLELRNCPELGKIPFEFAEKPSLDVLIVNHCPSAGPSAEKIQEQKKDIMLTIFPPIRK